MGNASLANRGEAFRVFISHKVSGHGGAAEVIKHKLENFARGRLSIFVSPALEPGIKWKPEILKEIEDADLFVLLYLVEGIEMDWCLYEAGYFEREAKKSGRKLICVTNPGRSLPGPLEDRQRLEATEDGLRDLLRAIYADGDKPVWPELFDVANADDLKQLLGVILNLLQPVKRQPLSPRLWMTLRGADWMGELRQGRLPSDTRLEGESEALRQFGVGPGGGVSLADFCAESEFRQTLELYLPHVAKCLLRILEGKADLWVIPPVRVVRDGLPKILVPAYMERSQANQCRLEFLVYQAEPDLDPRVDTDFNRLSNLVFLVCTFRSRIIDGWMEALKNAMSMGSFASAEDVLRKLRKFKLAYSKILLEAMNRNLVSPRQVRSCFLGTEDQEKVHLLMNPTDGLYKRWSEELSAALEADDLGQVVGALEKLRDLNKTLLVMCSARLRELSAGLAGAEIQASGAR